MYHAPLISVLTSLPIFPLLPLFAYVSADFCNSDPRVFVSRHQCSSPHTLLQLPLIDANPYHALHDRLWAVSHYLSQCVRSPLTINVTLQPYNSISCSEAGSSMRWGLCVTHAITDRIGATISNTPKGCFSSEIRLGYEPTGLKVDVAPRGDFRGMSWFGCETCENRSSLIPLSDNAKTNALAILRDAVLEMIGVPTREDDGRVHVLLYDRNDTNRRQWVNADQVHEKLHNDQRVELIYLRKMPLQFKSQVLLYVWADIVIAPHGAAMVNTVLMRTGSDVIEVWKHCDENVMGNPHMPRDWTGWHAQLLGINLRYIQCHRAESRYKNESELEKKGHGVATDGPHKVRVNEIMEAVEQAVLRQRESFNISREKAVESKEKGDSSVLIVVHSAEGYYLARGVVTFVLTPSCIAIFVIWRLSLKKSMKPKRDCPEELKG